MNMGIATSATAALSCAAVILLGCGPAMAEEKAPDPAIAATVEAFHGALKNGDTAGVMALLAPDARILESGHTETRAQYEKGHLAADIEFARAVPSTRTDVVIRQQDSVAWATSASRTTGKFKERDVDSAGAELIVLSETAEGWRIRAVHWSSYSLLKKK